MMLGEFIAPLASGSQREVCLAVLYYQQHYHDKSGLTAEEIRVELIRARVPKASKINVADVLNKSGGLVDSPGVSSSRRLWQLTTSGEAHIRGKLSLPAAEPEIEHDVATLQELAAKVSDAVVRDYILEAIKCLSVGAPFALRSFFSGRAPYELSKKSPSPNILRVSTWPLPNTIRGPDR